MANVSRPFGLRPTRYLNSSAWNGQAQLYGFSASQANDSYKGDVVQFDATNRTAALTDPYMPGLPFVLPFVASITTTTTRGVVVGFLPEPDFSMTPTASLGLTYRKASTARYVLVIDDVGVIFEAEEAGNSYTSTSSNGVNTTFDISYVAGSTITGISKSKITGSQTAAVRPLRALWFTQRPDNFNFLSTDTNSATHFDLLLANSDLAQANKGA